MGRFVPINKHILVEKEKVKLNPLVPEEFQNNLSPHTTVKVLACADDCVKVNMTSLEIRRGDTRLVVQTNGIEEVQVGGETHYIVPESFVVGKWGEDK